MDIANLAREQIFGVIRALTSATVAEAEDATRAIIRVVDQGIPDGVVKVPASAMPAIRSLISEEIDNLETFRAVNGGKEDKRIAILRDARDAFPEAWGPA